MRLFIFYIILSYTSSCTNSTTKNDFKKLVTDTSPGQFDDLEFGKFRSSMLNLQQINNGVDSFELRIWNFGTWSPKELVVFRYFDNKWTICNYSYHENEKQIVDTLEMSCKQLESIVAEKIENYLTQDCILTLPSQTAIPNFKDNSADGDTYFIEIATKRFYKTLGYHNPQYFRDTYNKQFIQLIRFLELHFNFFHTY